MMKHKKEFKLLKAGLGTQLIAISFIALMILTAIPITAGITKGTPQLSINEPKTLNPEKITTGTATEKELPLPQITEEKPSETKAAAPSSFLDVSKELIQPPSSKSTQTFADISKSLDTTDYVPGEILVKFKQGIDVTSPDKAIRMCQQIAPADRSFVSVHSATPIFAQSFLQQHADEKSLTDLTQWVKVTVENNVDVLSEVENYKHSALVETAQPNYIMHAYLEPNDPYYQSSGSWGQSYPDMWGLHQIEMSRAWDVTTGSHDVVVAVVDTGVDYNHPDLQGNMWINPDEIPNNGVDDDHDGFVDNIYGADFVGISHDAPQPDSDPMDDMGHGTHCAGTIAAVGNNNLGVVGINWHCQIMAVKALDHYGSGLTDTLLDALVWAAENGAQVLSNSWGIGTRVPSDPIYDDVMHYIVDDLGCVAVFAAGNSQDNVQYYSPQNIDEVITVAAVDPYDTQAYFTNWGDQVAVCAPGVDILSLRANGTDMYGDGSHTIGENYMRASGTSMACPHVAGLAALLLVQDPSLTPAMIKAILKETGDPVNSFRPIGLRINAADALNRVKAAIASFNYSDWANMKGIMPIYGTANGALFESYDLEYGIGYNPTSWTQIISSTIPVTDGILGSFDVTGLPEGTYTLRLNVFYGGGLVKTFSHLIVVNNIQNTYIVSEISGPGVDFTMIQDAVNVSGKNDIVFVRSGTYQQLVKIDRPLHLLGENRDTTFIDGGYTAHIIITIATDDVTIEGFTFRRTGLNSDWMSFDSAIFISSDRNHITGNRFFDVAVGIGMSNAMETMIDENIFQCRVGGNGIYFVYTSKNSVQNNIFYGPCNGIYTENSDHIVIQDNIFTGSNTDTYTGIVFFWGTSCNTIENNTIQNYGYAAGDGAGILCFYSSQNLIIGNRVERNGNGINIAFRSNNNTVVDNILLRNIAYGVCIYPDLSGYWGGRNNLLYHNNFIDNDVNAYDPSSNNMWYNSSLLEGNYWSDFDEPSEEAYDEFHGPDQDIPGSDGIVDSWYYYFDAYPLIHPYPLGSACFYVCAQSSLNYGYIGDLISFTGSADRGISPYNWTWDLGDGTIPYEQNATHVYTQVGRYMITLTVTDHEDIAVTDTIYITIDTPMIVNAEPYIGYCGIPIQFASSVIGGVSPYMWLWNFGDRTSSCEQNPIHSYKWSGTYDISLIVVDTLGTIVIKTVTVIITNVLLVDAHGPYIGTIGEPIQFIGSAQGGNFPYNWTWDFGDGTISTEQNPTHIYLHLDVFPVTLTVIDSLGNTANDTTTVTTILYVDAHGPYTGIAGEPIQFSETIQGGSPPYNWTWDFGDGNTSALQNPMHTYLNSGIYNVTLTVTDSASNTETNTTIATIMLNIDAHGPYIKGVGESVQFTGSAEGGLIPYTWLWDFGDGTNSTVQNPSYIYANSGTHTVTLTVIDSVGNRGTDSTTALIKPVVVSVDGTYNSSTPGWGCDHFASIQDGINMVADYGTVNVHQGVYYEHIIIDKTLCLVGEDKDTTIIDGGSPQNINILEITAEQVRLSGFTIRHCRHQGHLIPDPPPSAITIWNYSGLTVVTGNIITDNDDGICLYASPNNIIYENDFINNNYGVYIPDILEDIPPVPPRSPSLHSSDNNLIYHNNFINNGHNTFDKFTNFWNKSYPFGGNYWSGYTWNDNFHGPNQDIPGGDGIGDTPYLMPGGNSHDSYPLMHRFILGDVNNDGAVTFADIDPFVAALGTTPETFQMQHPMWSWLAADCNQDGRITFADIDPFVQLLGQ